MHSSPGRVVQINTARYEIDNHANTRCISKNLIPLSYTNRACDVHAFTDQVETVSNILVVTGTTACEFHMFKMSSTCPSALNSTLQ